MQFIEENLKEIDLSKYTSLYRSFYDPYFSDRYLRSQFIKEAHDSNVILKRLSFTEKFQEKLFQLIFSPIIDEFRFYHYSSFESVINILKTQKIRFSSIAGLNDKSEIYYTEKLLNREIKQPYHPKRIQYFNSRFILSNSLNQDELNQWRLYGENGKGICLEFKKVNKHIINSNFSFGKIAYGNNIYQIFLELIIGLIKNYNSIVIFNQLDLWKHFVKHEDYKPENELRILFHNSKKNGTSKALNFRTNSFGIFCPYIEFDFSELPFELTGIYLGPKSEEPNLNRGQLNYFLRSSGLNKIKITFSTKTHYR
ncbi:DUF2971 domain-containing protein [Leptospira congkakensis]|nr:DUF2971 domain-containing protein [Leptospira congkakensis]